MRFNTHDRTPKIETRQSIKVMLTCSFGLLAAFVVFIVIACSLYVHSITPAVIVLVPVLVLAILIAITLSDMDKAYVEIVDNVITVVDYNCGIKKEKTFSMFDVAAAEVLPGYSMRVRSYRWGNAGCTYIVFRDAGGNDMF